MHSEIRTAVVTGGGHGIGRAICRRLGSEGIKVAVADLDADGGLGEIARVDGRQLVEARDLDADVVRDQ